MKIGREREREEEKKRKKKALGRGWMDEKARPSRLPRKHPSIRMPGPRRGWLSE